MSKLPYDIMQKYIFNRTGIDDPDVLCGPAMGEDELARLWKLYK